MITAKQEQLISEIMGLAFAIDSKTDHCVFIRYYGHVSSLELDVAESKRQYQVLLIEEDFYIDSACTPKLNRLKAKLAKILKNGLNWRCEHEKIRLNR